MSEKAKVLDQLRAEKAALANSGFDPEEVRSEWLSELRRLFKTFRTWTKDAKRQGLLEIRNESVHLEEERLGGYDAPALRIASPRVAIRIVPRARNVIGALGRVDFETPSERLILIRSDSNTWKFARLVGHRWETTELTEGTFWNVLGSLLQ